MDAPRNGPECSGDPTWKKSSVELQTRPTRTMATNVDQHSPERPIERGRRIERPRRNIGNIFGQWREMPPRHRQSTSDLFPYRRIDHGRPKVCVVELFLFVDFRLLVAFTLGNFSFREANMRSRTVGNDTVRIRLKSSVRFLRYVSFDSVDSAKTGGYTVESVPEHWKFPIRSASDNGIFPWTKAVEKIQKRF